MECDQQEDEFRLIPAGRSSSGGQDNTKSLHAHNTEKSSSISTQISTVIKRLYGLIAHSGRQVHEKYPPPNRTDWPDA
jgi:hypothetical protein